MILVDIIDVDIMDVDTIGEIRKLHDNILHVKDDDDTVWKDAVIPLSIDVDNDNVDRDVDSTEEEKIIGHVKEDTDTFPIVPTSKKHAVIKLSVQYTDETELKDALEEVIVDDKIFCVLALVTDIEIQERKDTEETDIQEAVNPFVEIVEYDNIELVFIVEAEIDVDVKEVHVNVFIEADTKETDF